MIPLRTVSLAASAALTTAGLVLAAPTLASAAPVTAPSFLGYAYGTSADVGPLSSGQTAKLSVCTATPNASYGNNVAKVNLGGPLGRVGAVTTAMTTGVSGATVTATTADTSLLGGLIQASSITAKSGIQQSGANPVSTGSTEVLGLKIAGLPRVVPVGVNAKIDLLGIGTITFNRQSSTKANGLSQLTVDALRVDLLKDNKLGLAAGAVVVSSATAGVHSPTFARAGGTAYGAQVDLAGVVSSGPVAVVGLPCGGSNGAVIKNSIGAVDLPKVLTTGVVASTGQSVEGEGTTTARFGNEVSGINLLNGVITADAVKVQAATTRNGSVVQNSAAGTTITNLRINGVLVDVATGENATIQVAGLGTLTLRKTVPLTDGLDVIGLELKLNTDRLGVVSGTVIQVAVAKSRVVTS